MKFLLHLAFLFVLTGCGTPATQKPLFERTLKRDVYYCVKADLSSKDEHRIKAIEKITGVPYQDELFKKMKGSKEYGAFATGSMCGTFPYPSTAYFKWIDVSTEKIYEETANLHEALEGMSVHGMRITFSITGDNRLFIHMKKAGISGEKKPSNWPRVPELEEINPYTKIEKFWQLHPQPSPTKGLK